MVKPNNLTGENKVSFHNPKDLTLKVNSNATASRPKSKTYDSWSVAKPLVIENA